MLVLKSSVTLFVPLPDIQQMLFLQLSESGALSANETDFAKSQEPKAKSRFEQGQVPSMAVQASI